jgi:hypothetical protein
MEPMSIDASHAVQNYDLTYYVPRLTISITILHIHRFAKIL